MSKGRDGEVKSDDLAGAPVNEIKITPAMIAAGVEEIIWLDPILDSAEAIVGKVLAASLAVRDL
jgi:hypothetical protein